MKRSITKNSVSWTYSSAQQKLLKVKWEYVGNYKEYRSPCLETLPFLILAVVDAQAISGVQERLIGLKLLVFFLYSWALHSKKRNKNASTGLNFSSLGEMSQKITKTTNDYSINDIAITATFQCGILITVHIKLVIANINFSEVPIDSKELLLSFNSSRRNILNN